MGQAVGNRLHVRVAGITLGLVFQVDQLTIVQLDDPAIPGADQAGGLPGLDQVQEQRIGYGEILAAVIEAEFTHLVTADAASDEYRFFEYRHLGKALQGGGTGEAGQACTDYGYAWRRRCFIGHESRDGKPSAYRLIHSFAACSMLIALPSC